MRMSTDKPCSGASAGAPANSLQLWREGRYIPFTCIQVGLYEYIECPRRQRPDYTASNGSSHEVERILKEAFVAQSRYYPDICPEE
jgi:hypothetical protein